MSCHRVYCVICFSMNKKHVFQFQHKLQIYTQCVIGVYWSRDLRRDAWQDHNEGFSRQRSLHAIPIQQQFEFQSLKSLCVVTCTVCVWLISLAQFCCFFINRMCKFESEIIEFAFIFKATLNQVCAKVLHKQNK